MLYYDLTEGREGTRLPENVIAYGTPFPGLEAEFGADLAIVPEASEVDQVIEMRSQGKSFPEIAKTLKLEVKQVIEYSKFDLVNRLVWNLGEGAMLVQRKSGMDFLASMSERCEAALARMCRNGLLAHKQYQRAILVTGVWGEKDGRLTYNGHITNYDFWSYAGYVNSLAFKGATVYFLERDDLILQWVKMCESQMLKYKRKSESWVYETVYYPADLPDIDDPLSLSIEVKDARKTMITFPGLGAEKINTLYNYLKQLYNTEPTLLQMLQMATNYDAAELLSGWGEKQIKKNRRWLGLPEISEAGITCYKTMLKRCWCTQCKLELTKENNE